MNEQFKLSSHYTVECFDINGVHKWTREFDNLVVNVGLDDALEQYFNGSAYTAAHFVLLTDGTPTFAAGDTMASHVGWVEVLAYTEANRQNYTPATASGQSVTNIASKATFNINADTTTIGGTALTTDNTKNGGTGTLFGGGPFTTGDATANNGDTVQVTIVVSNASA